MPKRKERVTKSCPLGVLVQDLDPLTEFEQLQREASLFMDQLIAEDTALRRKEVETISNDHAELQLEFMHIKNLIHQMASSVEQDTEQNQEPFDEFDESYESADEEFEQEPAEAEAEDSEPDFELADDKPHRRFVEFSRRLAQVLVHDSPEMRALFLDPPVAPVASLERVLASFARILTDGMMLSSDYREHIMNSLAHTLHVWESRHRGQPPMPTRGVMARLQAKSGRARGCQYMRAGLLGA